MTHPLSENEFHEALELRSSITDLISEIEDSELDRQEKLDFIQDAIRQLELLKEQI